MGTTLQNGVYLPNEGERNCYAGLKTNWEILDQKVADVTALQQAVAGALHREIVESLPTTDIDPNTIYMILSGTSATENVYNEFMYVNNAWELIGTSATDLTNYYTKFEVDGKLLLKANASDLTSHTGDTTIHVTTADKSKWNNGVSQSYVLRYSSSSVTDNSTIAYSTLDNTDNVKSGDKVIDVDGKIFSVVSVDTTNQTVTVGSALIDLALDANVVHTSGNETVGGKKTFNDLHIIGYGTQYKGARNAYILPEFAAGYSGLSITTMGFAQALKIGNFVLDANNKPSLDTSKAYIQISTGESNGVNACLLESRNSTSSSLGTSANKWSKIYGTEYYYGSNDIEFSTKFVTTDTNQTITNVKTFASSPVIYNSDTTATTPQITFKNSKVNKGSTTETGAQLIYFTDKNNQGLGQIEVRVVSNGTTGLNITSFGLDSNNQNISSGVQILRSPTTANFAPNADNAVTCGRTLAKWSDVQTYRINNLTPSSLSLPMTRDNAIDISSYFTNFNNGDTNQYTPTVNGWIYLETTGCNALHCFCTTTGNLAHYGNTVARASDGLAYVLFPVLANMIFKQTWYTNSTVTLGRAWFIPCQGNV